ncbi:hypothetical protein ACA910_001758 [Epithemia clementina (nom. ined.)]
MKYGGLNLVLFVCFSIGICDSLSSVMVIFDSSNSLHRDMTYHPEQPERISATIKELRDFVINSKDKGNLLELVDVAEAKSAALDGTPYDNYSYDSFLHEPFSDAELEHARKILLKTHKGDLVTRIEESCKSAKERRIREGKDALGHMGHLDPDTFLTTETYAVCLRATAAWIKAVDVASKNRRPVMALTRPPGHHATSDSSNGFCIFNFAAATAVHVLDQDADYRVSILDWDVHYGQGVADIIQHFPNARYVSIHQTPAFPYMGESFRVSGANQNILTIPIQPETSWTCGYKDAFYKALDFISKDGEWSPDVVIVCAGYDALDSDDLASCSLQANDYGEMSKLLQQHLERTMVPNKRQPALILGLEGGYQLSNYAGGGNLQQAIVKTLEALI